jgi:hypothetical protein
MLESYSALRPSQAGLHGGPQGVILRTRFKE